MRHLGSGTVPTWSPDGEQIAFRRVSNKWQKLGTHLIDASLDIDFDEITDNPRGNVETDPAKREMVRLCDGGWPFWTPDGKSCRSEVGTRPSRLPLTGSTRKTSER